MSLPTPYYSDDAVTIYHADCRDILPKLPKVDLVLTDPPYPDQHPEYGSCDISMLDDIPCRQFVFWSAIAEFPLTYTAIHVWDKMNGASSQYERIFERNGNRYCRIYRHKSVAGNILNAQMNYDILTEHPSQKPQRLVCWLINQNSKPTDLLVDPFLGAGTTTWCAKRLGRKCIGIEIEEKYCEIAAKRCSQMVMALEVG